MLSFSELELAAFGAATVIDLVLLLAILERRNWRHVALPVALLMLGALLWHGGGMVRLLFFGLPGPWARAVQWAAMLVMAAGLGLLPSAMLHGLWRLWHSGLQPRVAAWPWYGIVYLPLLLLWPVGSSLATDPQASFTDLLQSWLAPYAVWLGLVNLATAAGMCLVRRNVEERRSRDFLAGMAAVLLGLAVLQSFVLLVAVPAWPDWKPQLMLSMAISPLVPAILFGYFVIRFNFMRLVLERSAVYGAILVGLLLVHHLAFDNLRNSLSDRYRIDLGIIEAGLLLSLVLFYRPLRRRAAEALSYLMGSRIDVLREGLRRLSLELAERSASPPRELFAWFLAAIRETLSLKYSAGWLFEPDGTIAGSYGDSDAIPAQTAELIYRELAAAGCSGCTHHDAPTPAIDDALDSCDASLAATFQQSTITGLVLLGRRHRNRDPGNEVISAVMLLCEQLSVTLNSSALQLEALAAERRALHHEKLSVMGLLASSIAHEVKNPLSSIKTIAAVLAEELAGTSHTEDLRLILSEIDRLSAKTTELLQFARPPSSQGEPSRPDLALHGTLQVMRHLAREQGIALDIDIADGLPPVAADASALGEIFFNLLSNSLEAAGAGGRVAVRCCQENGCVIARFQDSGPGIAPEVQDRLFEPFVTTKQSGTGLGLYATKRRVRECGGAIACESDPERGTVFSVKLPIPTRRVSEEGSPSEGS